MLDDGIFKGDTIGTDDVGIDDEVIFGFGVANSGSGIPDFFGIFGLIIHAGDNGGKEHYDNRYDTDNTKNFIHDSPLVD